MLTNPEVEKNLIGIENLEIKKLIYTNFRYDSKSGKGLADSIGYEKSTGDYIGKSIQSPTGNLYPDPVMKIFIQVCPSFEEDWKEYLSRWGENEERGITNDLAEFAYHIVWLRINNKVEEFNDIFNAIEYALAEGNDAMHNILATGLLENIQNITGNMGGDPDAFIKWLGPVTKMWWDEINRFWGDLEKYHEKSN